MKLLFLRGGVPKDRSPKEIMYSGLQGNDDMWEHLACAIGNERCEIVYFGGDRIRQYNDKDTVVWTRHVKDYKADFEPDAVFHRGAFEEFRPILKRYKHIPKVFYGAGGEHWYPEDGIKYDIVLVDSERQLHKAKKRGLPAYQWIKPAHPMFTPHPEVPKEFDVCYVGDGRFPYRAKKKNIHWFYKTCPKSLKILHLGFSGPEKPPENVTVRRVQRAGMALEYAKCRIMALPYTCYDSAPRTLTEAVACGLPVVVSKDVHYAEGSYPGVVTVSLDNIWDYVNKILQGIRVISQPIKQVTLEESATYIRKLIENAVSAKYAVPCVPDASAKTDTL